MTRTEMMLRERYHKKIPVEVLEDELLLDAKQVKLLLADYATVEVSIDTANKSYKYISFRTMMDILKCL